MSGIIELTNAETGRKFTLNTRYIIKVDPVEPYDTEFGSVNAEVIVNEITEAKKYAVTETSLMISTLWYQADKVHRV